MGQCSQAAGPGQAAEVSASSEWLGCVWDCAANTVGQLRRQLRQAFTAPAAESGAPLQSPSFYISMIVESLEETGAGRLGLRGAGRRSRGEQAERSESHHRLPSSAVVRFTLTRSCALPSHIFPSGLSRDCIGRTSSLDSIPMRHEPFRYLACTHCGTQSSYPIRLIEQYSGRIARRCETCGLVFDIQIPLKRES